MDKKRLNEHIQMLYETYGKADTAEVTPTENVYEFLKNNGYITLSEFEQRLNNLKNGNQ